MGSSSPGTAMAGCWVGWALLAVLPLLSHPTPIFKKLDTDAFINPVISPNFCVLPPELDNSGNVTFLEDCPGLDRFDKVPMPAPNNFKLGVHPVVCCPKYISPTAICFPSDAWCPTYEEIVYDYQSYDTESPDASADTEGSSDSYDDYQYEYVEGPEAATTINQPTMAERSCNVTLIPSIPLLPGINNETNAATCTLINKCSAMVDNPQAPSTHIIPCGFDEDKNKALKQKPRFLKDNKAHKCQDQTKLCSKWKANDGCRLDTRIVISEKDPYNGLVDSKPLFDFMQTACPQTCDLCGNKGCVDEHPRCQDWAREGQCVLAPFFMAHTCRESCGVCGFLSPLNKEIQNNNGDTYSDFTASNFDCGKFKQLCEINGEDCTAATTTTTTAPITTTTTTQTSIGADLFDIRTIHPSDIFFSSDPDTKSKGEYFCGATVVADRWVVAASHCYDDFRNGVTDGPRKVRVNTIRDNTPYKELVEIKRVYKHPNYRFPNLYNDVAVLELGRRIEYNYTKFGDSPSCLPKKEFEVINKIATVQGYGVTESGTKGDLLETNVTVITNKYCKEILQANVTKDQNNAKKILKALPLGLDYGLMCAQGIYKADKGIYTGSCKGDSGGPLTQRDEEDRTTLIGIVSGGIDCGKGFPGWYTRVEYYKVWIQCIIDKSLKFNNDYAKVHEACAQLERVPRKQPDCEEAVADPDIALFDLRTIGNATAEEICIPYKTGTFARADT